MMYQRDALRALYVIGYMWRFTSMMHVWCVEIPCDECWCMDVDEWMMSADAWMLMNEWWVLMHECLWTNDEYWWWMMNKWCRLMNVRCMLNDALVHLWCVMQWCMLNRSMWVKYMCIFCNHNCILYWFCNCFNVLILMFVFVCLSGLQ